jgi:hypothetical protein
MIEGQTLHPGSLRKRQVCLSVCCCSFLFISRYEYYVVTVCSFLFISNRVSLNHEYVFLYAHFYLLVTKWSQS